MYGVQCSLKIISIAIVHGDHGASLRQLMPAPFTPMLHHNPGRQHRYAQVLQSPQVLCQRCVVIVGITPTPNIARMVG
jgi:hypothetical protein